ncbi:hypothetical protein BV25DRAFT_640016 [Artomyces pyxidatus]|uniref:Uncharacterized protein n=1 Tax=Artomyces pyxidatus TaxID=48021 RepID=A0ACB8T1B9_9AGAM|nr:hypothetical protein BV25DRAFT_640016 [Artomyces pyxidatus]
MFSDTANCFIGSSCCTTPCCKCRINPSILVERHASDTDEECSSARKPDPLTSLMIQFAQSDRVLVFSPSTRHSKCLLRFMYHLSHLLNAMVQRLWSEISFERSTFPFGNNEDHNRSDIVPDNTASIIDIANQPKSSIHKAGTVDCASMQDVTGPRTMSYGGVYSFSSLQIRQRAPLPSWMSGCPPDSLVQR